MAGPVFFNGLQTVTFVAADYLQLKGAQEVGGREQIHYRLTQRARPDRLNFIWKQVQSVDLGRCADSPALP